MTKVRTVNHVREDRGLDPVDYGDEPIGSFGDTPYRPDEERDLGPDDPAALGADPEPEDDEDPEEPRALSRSSFSPVTSRPT